MTDLGADGVPNGKQHALALVIAGAVGVRLSEVAESDRAIDGSDDLCQMDLVRGPGQDVAAPDAALGSNESRPLEREKDLLEIGLR